MFMAAWGMFTSIVYLFYWLRFLFFVKKGEFVYFKELLGASVVGAVLAMGYTCIKALVG
jgi:hypothetical protein